MAKKSIGDLHATVTADAVQFVNEFKRADNEAKRSAASIKKTFSQQFGAELGKTGKQFAMSFLGAAAVGGIISQLREVSKNIDSIPGVPQSTIDSVRLMNYELAMTKRSIDQASAAVLGGFAKLGTAIGIGLGAAAYGVDNAAAALEDLNAEAKAFARAGFNKQIGELNAELERLNQGYKGQGLDDLDREADVLAELASTGVLNLKAYTNAKLEALKAQFTAQGGVTQADQDEAALQAIRARIRVQQESNASLKEYAEAISSGYEASQKNQISILSTSEALKAQERALARLNNRFREIIEMPSGIEQTKLITKTTKEIQAVESEIFRIKNSVNTASQEIAGAFSGAFSSLGDQIGDFVIDGEFKLSNFTDNIAKSIISTITKLAIINPILNGMFGQTNGWQALPSMFGFADGGRPPVGRASIIGEEGAELWVPDTAGKIIPNHEIGSMGGGGGGTVINADLRGASLEAVMRLEAYAKSIDATLEKRAIGAVENEKRRRAA